MQIRVDLDSTEELRIDDDLTTAEGITGIIVHIDADHVIMDTEKVRPILPTDCDGSQHVATNDIGQPATEQSALDGVQMTRGEA